MPPQFLIDAQGRPLNGHTNRLAERGSYKNSDFALPPTLTFTGMMGGANHTLWMDRFDEAMRSSRDDAKVMENDCFLMGLLQERKLAVASLPWHIEVPNPKDPVQLEVQTGLQDRVATMPRFRMFLMSILEAIWFGRYGEQVKWTWEPSGGRRFLHLAKWSPVNGDKIGHQEDGTPFILGNAARLSERRDIETIITTRGMAVRLNRQWRDRFIIHSHELYDADYFDYERAEAVFGLGVRSRVFFLNFLKLNFLGAVTTFMERVGLGITLWYFPAGNEKARAEAQAAAEDQSDRANILIPVYEDQKGAKSVERVEVPTTGSELLMKFSEQIDKWIERYVIGQSMSSGEDKESGLGGTGRAQFARDTKNQIRNMDAANLEETLTGTEEAPGLISMMQKYSYPETWPGPSNPRGFRARFVFDAESSDPDKKIEAGSKLFAMNIPVKMDEMREAAGFTKPDADDEVAVQQQPQQPGMPGAPGIPGGGGMPGQEAPGQGPPAAPGGEGGPPGAPTGRPGATPPAAGAPPSANGTAPAPAQPPAEVDGWRLSGVGPRGGHTWRKGNRTVRSRMPPGQSRDSGRFVDWVAQMAGGNGEGPQPLERDEEAVPYALGDWMPWRLLRGPRKGRQVFKNRVTGEERDEPPQGRRAAATQQPPESAKAPPEAAEFSISDAGPEDQMKLMRSYRERRQDWLLMPSFNFDHLRIAKDSRGDVIGWTAWTVDPAGDLQHFIDTRKDKRSPRLAIRLLKQFLDSPDKPRVKRIVAHAASAEGRHMIETLARRLGVPWIGDDIRDQYAPQGAVAYVRDAEGHEHKGKGEGGGRFTSDGSEDAGSATKGKAGTSAIPQTYDEATKLAKKLKGAIVRVCGPGADACHDATHAMIDALGGKAERYVGLYPDAEGNFVPHQIVKVGNFYIDATADQFGGPETAVMDEEEKEDDRIYSGFQREPASKGTSANRKRIAELL